MKPIENIEDFLAGAMTSLLEMKDQIEGLPALSLSQLPVGETLVLSIDMNNGFAIEGALSSPRVGEMVPPTAQFLNRCMREGYRVEAYSDCHTAGSVELESYPPHCMEGSWEHQLVDELSQLGLPVTPKNSTNAFFAKPSLCLDGISNLVITGCCTDICIYQCAIALKAYLNEHNQKIRVIVPVDLVETYDGPGHNGDLLNLIFLSSMLSNGIEVVASLN